MPILKMLCDGTMVDLEGDIPPRAFSAEVMATELSQINRFGGSRSRDIEHYTVAEPSVLCANLARRFGFSLAVQRACLLHDAHEVVTGDVLGPTKAYLRKHDPSDSLAELEARCDAVVGLVWGVDFDPYRAMIKRMDGLAEVIERDAILADSSDWPGHAVRRMTLATLSPPPRISAFEPSTARQLFMAKLTELFGGGA